MSEYRRSTDSFLRNAPWTFKKVLFLVILPLMLLGFVISFVAGLLNVASQPMKVVEKTMNADNIIHKYEWFHDTYTQQAARVNQIGQFKVFLREESDKEERQRLRMEMAAQQMSCRDLVAKYNANSEKVNVSLFKGWSLPGSLNPVDCE